MYKYKECLVAQTQKQNKMKYYISNSERCSITYKTSNDYVILKNDELYNALLQLVGKFKKFIVRNFYGSESVVEFTITSIEIGRYNNIGHSIVIEASEEVSNTYYPTPFQIAKEFGLICPISYSL